MRYYILKLLLVLLIIASLAGSDSYAESTDGSLESTEITEGLHSEDVAIVGEAINQLWEAYHSDESIESILKLNESRIAHIILSDDYTYETLHHAAMMLGGQDVDDHTVKTLINGLEVGGSFDNDAPALALWEIGIGSNYVTAIFPMLHSYVWGDRLYGARILSTAGPASLKELDVIVQSINDEHPETRIFICEAISNYGSLSLPYLELLGEIEANDPYLISYEKVWKIRLESGKYIKHVESRNVYPVREAASKAIKDISNSMAVF